MIRSCLCMLVIVLTGCVSVKEDRPRQPIQLFNGRDLSGWDIHTVEAGSENPGIFSVHDGLLKIAGGAGETAYFGGLISRERYSDYKLVLEYKFTGPTYGTRKGKARDSGILVHCIGATDPKLPWMTSYECQIIEGGTGDILIVNIPGRGYDRDDEGNSITLALTAEAEQIGPIEYLYKPGAPKVRIEGGIKRINWWGRDPKWKDVADFRGEKDIESPLGQWTRVEVICDGDTMTNIVNGQVASKAEALNITAGRILIQTEGAEMWVRKIELTPLKLNDGLAQRLLR